MGGGGSIQNYKTHLDLGHGLCRFWSCKCAYESDSSCIKANVQYILVHDELWIWRWMNQDFVNSGCCVRIKCEFVCVCVCVSGVGWGVQWKKCRLIRCNVSLCQSRKTCNFVLFIMLFWTIQEIKVYHILYTVEPHYNKVLGTLKITLLYQVSHYIRVKNQRNIKSWEQQNYLVIRGFCYIRPLCNEVPLYQ